MRSPLLIYKVPSVNLIEPPLEPVKMTYLEHDDLEGYDQDSFNKMAEEYYGK